MTASPGRSANPASRFPPTFCDATWRNSRAGRGRRKGRGRRTLPRKQNPRPQRRAATKGRGLRRQGRQNPRAKARRRRPGPSLCGLTAKTFRRPRVMNKPIYVVGGSKGGVGKSLVSMAMTHLLTEAGEKVFLIDADTSNPDVFKSYGAEVQCELVNLDDADGWIRFVNICDENKDAAVIVNTAARNNQGVAAYGATLSKSLEELDRDLVTLWVINRQRDSLELLKDYIEAIPDSTVHVVKNGYFGADAKFELFNNSQIKKAIEAHGGRSVLFPDMADRVSDDLYSNRLSIRKAASDMSLGNRAELKRWLGEAEKALSPVTAAAA